MTRRLLSTLLLPAALVVSVAASQSRPDYDALVSTIIGLLQAGKIDEAASKAVDAVALAPDRYDGHLYLGIARFRQNAVTDAEQSLTKALDLAPADRKAKVREALELVADTRRFTEYIATAESADREGARAKTARSYAAAWRLFPDRVDIATKALQGFVAVGDHFEAARVWFALTDQQRAQYLKSSGGKSGIDSRELKNETDRRRVALQDTIRAGAFDRATELATPMAEADFANYGAVAAALACLTSDRASAFRWAKTLKPEQLVRMDLFSEEQMNQMISGPVFAAYLEDVVGGNREHNLQLVREAIERPRLERERKAAAAKLEADTRSALDVTFRQLESIVKTLGVRQQGRGRVKDADGEPYVTEGFQVEYLVRSQPTCSGWEFSSTYLNVGAGRKHNTAQIEFLRTFGVQTFAVTVNEDAVQIGPVRGSFFLPVADRPIASKIVELLNFAAKACSDLTNPKR